MEQIPYGKNNISSARQEICYFLWNPTPSTHISRFIRTHLGNTPHPPDHSWAHWSPEDRYTCNPAALWLPGIHPGSSTG